MSLQASAPIAFVPTTRPEEARLFFEETLGLRFVQDDGFAMVFRMGAEPGVMLRVVRVDNQVAAPYTILGWEVVSIEESVDALLAKGTCVQRYAWLTQDARGIWTAPDGDRVAWFADPDGNTLSISQHA